MNVIQLLEDRAGQIAADAFLAKKRSQFKSYEKVGHDRVRERARTLCEV